MYVYVYTCLYITEQCFCLHCYCFSVLNFYYNAPKWISHVTLHYIPAKCNHWSRRVCSKCVSLLYCCCRLLFFLIFFKLLGIIRNYLKFIIIITIKAIIIIINIVIGSQCAYHMQKSINLLQHLLQSTYSILCFHLFVLSLFFVFVLIFLFYYFA